VRGVGADIGDDDVDVGELIRTQDRLGAKLQSRRLGVEGRMRIDAPERVAQLRFTKLAGVQTGTNAQFACIGNR
jgi:hypothetical protein